MQRPTRRAPGRRRRASGRCCPTKSQRLRMRRTSRQCYRQRGLRGHRRWTRRESASGRACPARCRRQALPDPVDDVAVAVRLDGLELDLVLLRQRAGRKDELLELAGGDSDAGGRRSTSRTWRPTRWGPFSTTAVQPGIGSVRADLRSGSATVSLVVEAGVGFGGHGGT